MVIIVIPYQNILITGSKAIHSTTERKYLSVFFVLRGAEKVDQKEYSKIAMHIKSFAKTKN